MGTGPLTVPARKPGWRSPGRPLPTTVPVLRELFEGIERVRYPSPDAFDDAEWMAVGRAAGDSSAYRTSLRRIQTEARTADVCGESFLSETSWRRWRDVAQLGIGRLWRLQSEVTVLVIRQD